MRTALVALATVLSAATVEAAPTVKQLMAAEAQAIRTCRGSTDPSNPTVQGECERSARLYGRIQQLGYCWGKKGQVEGQKEWHRCGKDSYREDDLQPSAN